MSSMSYSSSVQIFLSLLPFLASHLQQDRWLKSGMRCKKSMWVFSWSALSNRFSDRSSSTLWLVCDWLDVAPRLSFQFVKKSMMQEVPSPSSYRDLYTSCRSRYFSLISYFGSHGVPSELSKMSSNSLSRRLTGPSLNATWNEMI